MKNQDKKNADMHYQQWDFLGRNQYFESAWTH